MSDPAPERCSAAAPPVDPEDRTPGPAEGGSSALADGSVDSVDSGGSVGSVEPVGSVDVDVVGGELVSVVSVVVGDPGTGAVEDSHGGDDDGDSPGGSLLSDVGVVGVVADGASVVVGSELGADDSDTVGPGLPHGADGTPSQPAPAAPLHSATPSTPTLTARPPATATAFAIRRNPRARMSPLCSGHRAAPTCHRDPPLS
uniref:Uncharacterized protein n=1 Tax=Thermocrispum agreste TaxID=37925 RepID=A0A2W4JRK1_9PSEU|nr:MAG: hypothetical protein DIU77_03860 [Thermocrispum agreste]